MKKLFNIIPVLTIAMTLIIGTSLSAMAVSTEHEGECVYNGSKIESTFSSSTIAKAVENLQPGDDVTFTVTYTNGSDDDTDWYMENSIVQTLEKTSAKKTVSGTGEAGNGGYTYELTHYDKNGNKEVLFSNDEVGGETIGSLAKKIIMQEFVASANTYKKKPNAALMGVLKNMASFLGNNTELPAGDGTITVGAVMSSLNTAQEMSCFHDVQEAETGSDKELRAVQAVIRFAQNNGNKEIDDTTVRELAEKLLLSVYIGNANGYEGQSTRRKIMRTIAEWLPANTELRGADMTVQAFDNTVEPKHEILRIRDNLQEGTLSNRDLGALAYYATKWPDVDLGGGQMLHDIAKHFLHAAVVQAANAVQRNQYGSARDEFAAALAAAQTVPGCISGTEAKTLSRIISALSIMQTSCPSYRPEYPPFNVKKGGGRSGSGGLFKKLSGLFKKK